MVDVRPIPASQWLCLEKRVKKMLVGRDGSQEKVPRLYAWVSQLGAGLWDRDRPWAHELSTEKTSSF